MSYNFDEGEPQHEYRNRNTFKKNESKQIETNISNTSNKNELIQNNFEIISYQNIQINNRIEQYNVYLTQQFYPSLENPLAPTNKLNQ